MPQKPDASDSIKLVQLIIIFSLSFLHVEKHCAQRP